MANPKGMNAMRIRVVKLEPAYGVGDDRTFSVQISQDGLSWWNLSRFMEYPDAKEAAESIADTADKNFTAKASHVLWSTRV